METIVELAGYVLGATVLFGAIITFFLLRAYWFQPGAVVPHPQILKLPTEAVKAVRGALENAQRRQASATGTEKEEISREAQRLESRLGKVEQQTFKDQRDYQYAVKRREGAWLQWKELHDRASLTGRRLAPEMRDLLKDAQRNYVKSHRSVEEERHTAVARDMMNLEEIRGQEVLTPAPPEKEFGGPSPRDSVATREATQVENVEIAEDNGMRLAEFTGTGTGIEMAGRHYLDSHFELDGVGGMLRDADLSGTDFEDVEFRGTHIYRNCAFPRANLARIRLERQPRAHQFIGCDFTGVHFIQSRISYAVFSGCNLSRTHWAGAELDHVKFVDCAMDDVFWERVDLGLTMMSAEAAAQLDFSEAAAPPRTPSRPTPEPTGGQPDQTDEPAAQEQAEPAPVNEAHPED